MKPVQKASIGILAFVGGFFVTAFGLHALTRYGVPNPAFETSLLVRRDFWIFLSGLALFLGGGFCYYWSLAPSSPFKESLRDVSPKAVLSMVLSGVTLIGIPVSRFVGPWDFIQATALLLCVGGIWLIALYLSILSMAERRGAPLPIIAAVWCFSVAAIMYVRLASL
jgi:hypothetical protein